MSPQSNDTPGLNLPTPSLEAQHPAMAMQQPANPVAPMQPVMAPQFQPQQPMTAQQPQISPAAPNPIAQMAPVQSAPPEEPEDDDDDALDIEWIAKAKAIVEQLRLDPFAESNAFNEIKAEYLQRRHGKTVKVSK